MKTFVNDQTPVRERAVIITQTPMRITLGGGGTDVLWYSKLKGGAWISATINRFIRIKVTNSIKFPLLKVCDQDGEKYYNNPGELNDSIIRECLKTTQITGGLEIDIQSDVPAKSGLGGSGAFEVGLLNALHTFKNNPISPLTLAEQAAEIEIKKLKKPVGPQDQYITALGGINYFEIDKKGKVTFEPLHLSDDSLKKLQNNLLYFQTDIYHETAQILGDQKAKAVDNSKSRIIESLDQIKELGQQAKEFLLTGRIDDYGATLHKHWLIKKKLSDKVTNPQIDKWYERGIANGALGGKIMGAGGGGWLVFYVNSNQQQFIGKMSQMGLSYQRVNFDFMGTRQVSSFEASEKKIINSTMDVDLDNYVNNYLGGALSAIYQLNKQDLKEMILKLEALKKNKGRLFLIGVGGSAANCSHAVNDFRKIAGIEAYAPTDNVSELTARTNDDGWETVFINWLKGSNLGEKDAVFVLSVGGGNMEKNISVNIVKALEYAKSVKAMVLGIVSRNGGYTKQVADCCLMVPVINDEFITPYAESFQALLWHLLAFSPNLRVIEPY